MSESERKCSGCEEEYDDEVQGGYFITPLFDFGTFKADGLPVNFCFGCGTMFWKCLAAIGVDRDEMFTVDAIPPIGYQFAPDAVEPSQADH